MAAETDNAKSATDNEYLSCQSPPISPYTRSAYLAAQAAARKRQQAGQRKNLFLPQPLTVLAVFVAIVAIAIAIGAFGGIDQNSDRSSGFSRSAWGKEMGDKKQTPNQLAGTGGNGSNPGGQDNSADREDKEDGLSGSLAKKNNANRIYVHVVGQVRSPGLIELPVKSRVADAIKAAGGTIDPVDLRQVNLARILNDGEQLAVLKPGETISGGNGVDNENNPFKTGGTSGPETGNGSRRGGKINLNLADVKTLEQLTGVGPSLAQRIVEYRKNNGRFGRIEELKQVEGIGEKKYAALKDQVCL